MGGDGGSSFCTSAFLLLVENLWKSRGKVGILLWKNVRNLWKKSIPVCQNQTAGHPCWVCDFGTPIS